MMAILLVAARDFRQIVSTRGFKVTVLILPLAVVVSIVGGIVFAPKNSPAFTLVDASGRYGPQIERRLELDYQAEVLSSLSRYVDRWIPAASWARRGAAASDAEVARFAADGGAPAVLRRLRPQLPQEAPPFKPPTRPFVEIPPPDGAPADQGPGAFGRALAHALQGDVSTPDGKRPFALAVYIPSDYGEPGSVVRIWTNGRSDGGLVDTIRAELSTALRQRGLQAGGLSADTAARVLTLSAPVEVSDPPAGGEPGRVIARSLVPLALVYLLLITAFTTGSMMLQGLIEERSNRLLEAVLACIRPEALMYGKLLGLGGVGLCIVAAWAGCAVGAAFAAPGFVSDLLRPSLTVLEDPWIVAALIFYFLSGYVVVSMLFLAVGSLSDSVQDAQSYLAPVLMLITIPLIVTMQVAVRSPDSPLPHVLSWIPLYTPFVMLARLGAGVPLPEMLGTGAVLIAFLALELLLLGRLFRASLLGAGQPSRAEVLARLMFQSPDH